MILGQDSKDHPLILYLIYIYYIRSGKRIHRTLCLMNLEQLLPTLTGIHRRLSGLASRPADLLRTARDHLYGFYPMEFGQQGADRASCGTRLPDELRLRGLRGASDRTLRLFRQFYLTYPQLIDFIRRESTGLQTFPDPDSFQDLWYYTAARTHHLCTLLPLPHRLLRAFLILPSPSGRHSGTLPPP
jgi:hypothetical protein